MTYTPVTHSLDEETIQLLEEIARAEADDERPNESKTLRKMIREKARSIGVAPKKTDLRKPNPTKTK